MEHRDVTDPDSLHLERKRRAAVRTYLTMSIIQFTAGVGSIACAAFATHLREEGFPYYAGGFANGSFVSTL
ncbi:hypothetical protein MAR_027603 [Mya arenaria]|uniref:Uncharacterized protein n=1 Tax=Mya arenaria TaxID=6604 RepID=A0ABY7ETZ7_MYAAR|nr:hypothetical protein MAR_027603 [Mya arenaria]